MGTDSLYYIMDYRGNYYRTNQADQLVAVAREQDATVFTFTQANRRICGGKKAAFYCMVPIDDSADREEEESSFLRESMEEDTAIQAEEGGAVSEEYVSPVKELVYDEVTEPIAKSVSTYDLAEMDWEEYLIHFTYLVEGIQDYREELTKKHSDIDQKICDILHYIELCETNEDEAVDLVGLLRVCREKRRDIKDEIQRIEYFQKNLGTNVNEAKAKLALKSIQGLATRKYKPRKYEELFENCVLKHRRLERADIQEEANREAERQSKEQAKKQTFCVEHRYEKEGGEAMMTLERNYTPFDGKDNDWLTFARRQAEFYRNAETYIHNLQLDIREIDDEIEEILLITEDANYNVAQGYKVFKRLKELRLARKAKAKEVDCLHALTHSVDCNAFADACEAGLTEVEDIMGINEQREIVNIQPVNRTEEMHTVDKLEGMVG